MHVAGHALARWDRARELMHHRMTALGFWNRLVGGETQTLMAELAPTAGIGRRTIIRVNDVARGASARSIIPGMIVRSEKSEERIVQSRFLQTEKNGIGAVQCSETALRKSSIGMAIWFLAGWQA